MRTSQAKAGNSLLGVILFTLVLSTMLLTLVAGMTTDLRLVTADGNRAQAELCADSAIYEAIAELKRDPEFTGDIHYQPTRSEDLEGHLTFQVGDAPYSTNNVRAAGSTLGYGHSAVPSKTVHLVAVGRCANSVVQREAYIHFPPFPFALACSGAVEVSGTTVGSVEDLTSVSQGVSVDDLLPGNLLSGNDVTVGPDTLVTGDLRAVGSIQWAGGVVRGRTEEHTTLDNIPRVSVTSYEPGPNDYPQPITGSSHAERLSLDSTRAVYRGQNLILRRGLELHDSLLYVDGDLEIHGGVTGHGAVVCTGNVTVVDGATDLRGELTALVAGGDVRMEGGRFQGLVYTEGDFVADQVEVVGAFIANGASSSVRLTDATVVQLPEATSFEVTATRPSIPPLRPREQEDLARLDLELIQPSSVEDFRDSNGLYAWNPAAIRVRAGGGVYNWDALPNDVPPWLRERAELLGNSWRAIVMGRIDAESGVIFRLDLNEILGNADQARLVVWR